MSRELTEAGLEALGHRLGRELPTGTVVWLEGELGAGKTTLVRAIAGGRGATDQATSPTFALVHRYEGLGGPVFHVDCYRLRSPEEASELDWQSLVGGDLLLVEWPARAGPWVPPAGLRITLGHVDRDDVRTVTMVPGPDLVP